MPTDADEPVLHCPHCFGAVGPWSHFCAACGMPITSHSTIGPLEQVWSFGWLVNRLLEQRPSGLAVLGTWLISIPFLLPAVPMIVLLPLVTPPGDMPHVLVGIIPIGFMATCYAILVARVTAAYYRGRS